MPQQLRIRQARILILAHGQAKIVKYRALLKGYPETYLSLSCRRVKEMTQGTYQGQGSHAKIVPFRPDRRAVEPGQ
jgi:hypothetical protein